MATKLEEYRQQGEADSRKAYEAARAAYDRAATKAAKRRAAADLEFWGNRLAFFSNVKA